MQWNQWYMITISGWFYYQWSVTAGTVLVNNDQSVQINQGTFFFDRNIPYNTNYYFCQPREIVAYHDEDKIELRYQLKHNLAIKHYFLYLQVLRYELACGPLTISLVICCSNFNLLSSGCHGTKWMLGRN